MTASGWIQLVLVLGAITALTKPVGVYLVHVLDPEREGGTFLDPVLGPFERFIYRVLRVRADRGQTWMQYTLSMLIFSAVTAVLTYAILRLAGQAAAQPARHGRREPAPGVQHGGQLRDQYELAELRRRVDDELPLADGGPGDAPLLLGGRRHRHRRSPGARHRRKARGARSATSGAT